MTTPHVENVCSRCSRSTQTLLDYYWRDYTGAIPSDAVPGGHDAASRTTYIGQGFCYKVGILPGTLYQGISSIKVPYNGYSNSSKVGIKILCSPNANCFSWEKAEAVTLHLLGIYENLVTGGCEEDKYIYIGRAKYQQEVIVGKVLGDPGKAKLYFVHDDKEIELDAYEILVYTPAVNEVDLASIVMGNEMTVAPAEQICAQCSRSNQLNCIDYYWRDFVGVIPHDAISGGHNPAFIDTYIGQAFCNKAGILPGTIYPNTTIAVPYDSASTTKVGIKILCSPNADCFSWEKAEAETLHLTSIHQKLVIGGCEDNKYVHIGRAKYQEEVIVGKVSGNAGKAKLHFVHEGKEIKVDKYEILVYIPKKQQLVEIEEIEEVENSSEKKSCMEWLYNLWAEKMKHHSD